MFYSEGRGEFGVCEGKTDFFVCFASGGLEGCFGEVVCFASWEGCLSCIWS
jgi:hypothetical protein